MLKGAIEVKPNVSLSYFDSGPPSTSTSTDGNDVNETTNAAKAEPYKTLFMLHGGSFYAPVFKRVLHKSTQYNIRFVAIIRRDYPGSTELDDDKDVKAIVHGSTAKRLGSFVKRVEEILLFINEFVERGWVLPRNEGGGGGGFSISGTSLGNLQGMSVLAFGGLFPDLVEKLAPYFRSYILHEGTVLFPPPPNAYHPLTDESIPREERVARFCNWIASYFEHPAEAVLSGDAVLLSQSKPSLNKPSTVAQFTREEHKEIIYHKALLRADLVYFVIDQNVNLGILERVFTGRSSISVELENGVETMDLPVAWPDVPVRTLYGDKTSWTTLFTQRRLEKWVQELRADPEGRWVRAYEPNCLQGINHFLYWDDPGKFLEMVSRLMV